MADKKFVFTIAHVTSNPIEVLGIMKIASNIKAFSDEAEIAIFLIGEGVELAKKGVVENMSIEFEGKQVNFGEMLGMLIDFDVKFYVCHAFMPGHGEVERVDVEHFLLVLINAAVFDRNPQRGVQAEDVRPHLGVATRPEEGLRVGDLGGKANLGDSYGDIKKGEVFLVDAHISPYPLANRLNHDPLRTRKLLLHKKEIKRLIGKVEQKGYTLIPIRLSLVKGKVKVDLALAKGKKLFDKRETLKKKTMEREMERGRKGFDGDR